MLRRKKTVVLAVPDGLILSGGLGVSGFIFLYCSHYLMTLLWQVIPENVLFPRRYYLVLGLTGGLVIAWCQTDLKGQGVAAGELLAELKTTTTLRYEKLLPNVLLAFLVLIFGGSVGPEAGGLTMIISLSVWLADKLRYMLAHQATVHKLSYGKRLAMLVSFKNYRQGFDQEKAIGRRKKCLLVALLIANGSLVFFLLMKQFNHSSFFVTLGKTDWGREELLIVVPLVILGVLFASVCQLIAKGIQRVSSYVSTHVSRLVMPIVTGGLLGCIGICAPNLLFSGQQVLTAIPSQLPSAFFLMGMAFLKYAITEWCLSTSWFGGHIFPILTSSVLFGYGVAQILPSFDQLSIVCVIAISGATWLLRSPVLVWVILSLYFPIELVPLSLVLAVGYAFYFRKQSRAA